MKVDTKKIKLIIADDHPVFRTGMETVLKSMAIVCKVAQAAHGQEVIDLLGHEHFDIVLMDINMKPMDGIEAAGIIKKRFTQTKVIALSMYNDVNIIRNILNKGAVGYLIKNADKEEIAKAIEEVHDGKTYYSVETSRLLIENKDNSASAFASEEIFKQEKFKEILFLLCHDFNNDEMADLLFLTKRTIENYRKQIKERTGRKDVFSLFKYAIDNGILDDAELKKKFGKYLLKK